MISLNVAFSLAILYSDLAATIPFGNSVDTFDLRGDHLKHAFEHAVGDKIKSGILQPKSLMQISGTIQSKTSNANLSFP